MKKEQHSSPPPRSMTIVEAVVRAMGRPLSPAEAYAAIIEGDQYRFNTDDPVAVVRNAIRRRCEGVEFTSALPDKLFRATNDGRYVPIAGPSPGQALALPIEPSLMVQIEALKPEHGGHVRARILAALLHLAPDALERFAERLLTSYGFDAVEVTRKSKDGGIDGHGRLAIGLTTVSVALQCKRLDRARQWDARQ